MHEALLLPNAEPTEAYDDVARISKELVSARRARRDGARQRWRWSSIMKAPGRGASSRRARTSPISNLSCASIGRCGAPGLSVDIVPPTAEAIADRRLDHRCPAFSRRRTNFAEALAKSGADAPAWTARGIKDGRLSNTAGSPAGSFATHSSTFASDVSKAFGPAHGLRLSGHGAFVRWREFLALGEKRHARAHIGRRRNGARAMRQRRFISPVGRTKNCCNNVLRRCCHVAGVSTLDLAEDIRVRDNGAMRYIFNYGATTTDISALVGDATLLLGERILEPCGVAAFRRRDCFQRAAQNTSQDATTK